MKNCAAVCEAALSVLLVGKKLRKYYRFFGQAAVLLTVEPPPQAAAAELRPAAAVAEPDYIKAIRGRL